jgi:hypothetical protein
VPAECEAGVLITQPQVHIYCFNLLYSDDAYTNRLQTYSVLLECFVDMSAITLSSTFIISTGSFRNSVQFYTLTI